MTLELSRREIALVLVTASFALVAGMWIGLLSVPDAALDVPKKTYTGYEDRTVIEARYHPMPMWFPIASLLPLPVAFWAYSFVNSSHDDADGAADTDNYLDHLGGDDHVDE